MACFPGGEEGLVRQITALNTSVAGMQQSMDDIKRDLQELKREVIHSFKAAREVHEDDERSLKARTASIGNQVAYLRDNVCHCLTNLVRYYIDLISIDT